MAIFKKILKTCQLFFRISILWVAYPSYLLTFSSMYIALQIVYLEHKYRVICAWSLFDTDYRKHRQGFKRVHPFLNKELVIPFVSWSMVSCLRHFSSLCICQALKNKFIMYTLGFETAHVSDIILISCLFYLFFLIALSQLTEGSLFKQQKYKLLK